MINVQQLLWFGIRDQQSVRMGQCLVPRYRARCKHSVHVTPPIKMSSPKVERPLILHYPMGRKPDTPPKPRCIKLPSGPNFPPLSSWWTKVKVKGDKDHGTYDLRFDPTSQKFFFFQGILLRTTYPMTHMVGLRFKTRKWQVKVGFGALGVSLKRMSKKDLFAVKLIFASRDDYERFFDWMEDLRVAEWLLTHTDTACGDRRFLRAMFCCYLHNF